MKDSKTIKVTDDNGHSTYYTDEEGLKLCHISGNMLLMIDSEDNRTYFNLDRLKSVGQKSLKPLD